jgi:hypothetical protein
VESHEAYFANVLKGLNAAYAAIQADAPNFTKTMEEMYAAGVPKADADVARKQLAAQLAIYLGGRSKVDLTLDPALIEQAMDTLRRGGYNDGKIPDAASLDMVVQPAP